MSTQIGLPTVSVIVPLYKCSQTIEVCLRSLAKQLVVPNEVILVDDSDPEHCAPQAETLCLALGLPYKLLRHNQNQGLAAARNTGLAEASSEFVAFLDSDDALAPDFFATLLSLAIIHDAQVAISRTLRTSAVGNSDGEVIEPPYRQVVVSGVAAASLQLRDELKGYACNKVFKRKLLGTAPFPVGVAYEDFAPILQVLLRTDRVALTNFPLYRYTDSPNSISNTAGQHTKDLFTQLKTVTAIVTDHPQSATLRRSLPGYQWQNVIMPVANMAFNTTAENDYCADLVKQARKLISATVLGYGLKNPKTGVRIFLLKFLPAIYRWALRKRNGI